MNVLVINCGSSSLKFQLIDPECGRAVARGLVDRIGVSGSSLLKLSTESGREETEVRADGHRQALQLVVDRLTAPGTGPLRSLDEVAAVGHRVVHGGEHFSASVLIDDNVVRIIDRCSSLAPLHNPPALTGIDAARSLLPGIAQVAVFDTAFYQSIPEKAYLYALPDDLYRRYGIRRYGFHGTSHRYVTRHTLEMPFMSGRTERALITCHLGNGCSITASRHGRAVDTSMGFTPLEGLVMGTRCGDIDPAIVTFLQTDAGMTAEEVNDLLNKESGLKGLTDISSDMRDIEKKAEEGDQRAELALEIFCYRIVKYIGAYAFAMGALDAVVFTAGIGENSPVVRGRVCRGLEGMGIRLDEGANRDAFGREAIISLPDSPVTVAVVPTNEELMIAQETADIIKGE